MNILVISHMYPSTYNNVAGIFVHEQVKELIKNGYNVKVVSPVPAVFFPLTSFKKKWREYGEIPKKDIIDGVEVYYPRYIEFPKGFFFASSGVFMFLGIKRLVDKIYKDFKFDIIHSHVALPDGYASMLLNKFFNVPHVVTIHGQDLQVTINKSLLCKNSLYKVFNNVDKIITVSSKLMKVIADDFKEKIEVIGNGINIEEIIECENMCLYQKNEDNDVKKILSVSNLIPSKGIDLNIKAIHMLKSKYPNIIYYIIGDGEEKENLIKLVESLNLGNNVKFLGRLSHKDVFNIMSQIDIFSLPSWQEGFGVVYIEAMAQGKPIIAVKGEGIQDIIEHGKNGFLIERKNYEQIANTIDYLLVNPKEAIKIGEEGKKIVIKEYTWEKNVKKTEKIYKKLLNLYGR
ncbi:MAG: glycosyltransferase [Bacillota bacterium]|nr:glycosyltransferase [Bacillota bacterium]